MGRRLQMFAEDASDRIRAATNGAIGPENRALGIIDVDSALRGYRQTHPDARDLTEEEQASLVDVLVPLNQELHRLTRERGLLVAETNIVCLESGDFVEVGSEGVDGAMRERASAAVMTSVPSPRPGVHRVIRLDLARHPELARLHQQLKGAQGRAREHIRRHIDSLLRR